MLWGALDGEKKVPLWSMMINEGIEKGGGGGEVRGQREICSDSTMNPDTLPLHFTSTPSLTAL